MSSEAQNYRVLNDVFEQHQQPRKMPRETFELWEVVQSSLNCGAPRFVIPAPSFDDAMDHLALRSMPKAKYVIKRTNTHTGEVTLHFFTIRKKSQGTRRYHDHQSKVVHDTYPEHLFDLKPGGLMGGDQ